MTTIELAQAELAVSGGEPVRTKPWPKWPIATPHTMQNLETAMHSGRWAISGCYTGEMGFEQKFSRAFADYLGSPYAVCTTNGSTAIKIALQEAGVGPGKEVLVPSLTWVACASTVVELGAVPILVDIDPINLSISVEAAEAAITEKTAAILVVHAYCACADIEGFVDLSQRTGVVLVEDCSQAHGAEWKGKKVGTFGELGVFSLQQTKVLTSGEGGIVVCKSKEAYERLQQYRANGRMYTSTPVAGQLEFVEKGEVWGVNHSMSEIHSAIALAQLEDLDRQSGIRAENGAYLAKELAQIPGVNTIAIPPEVTQWACYDYVIQLNPEIVGPFSIQRVVEAMSAELGTFFETLDAPMNANSLYNPLISRIANTQDMIDQLNPKRFDLPNAHHAFNTSFAFLHHLLLGTKEDMDDIVVAVRKVIQHLDDLGEHTSSD